MWFNNDRLELIDMYAFHKELKKHHVHGVFNVGKQKTSAMSRLMVPKPDVTEAQFIRQLQCSTLRRPMAASIPPASFYKLVFKPSNKTMFNCSPRHLLRRIVRQCTHYDKRDESMFAGWESFALRCIYTSIFSPNLNEQERLFLPRDSDSSYTVTALL